MRAEESVEFLVAFLLELDKRNLLNNKNKWIWIYDREKRLYKSKKIDILPQKAM